MLQLACVKAMFNNRVKVSKGTYSELAAGIKAKWSQRCVVDAVNGFITQHSSSQVPKLKDDRIRLLRDTLRSLK